MTGTGHPLAMVPGRKKETMEESTEESILKYEYYVKQQRRN
jgi:hypothetical protein